MHLQRLRWSSALTFAACISCEYATPFYPHLFIPLAGIANVGKAISLTAFVATQPAVLRSFALAENLADMTAKCQAQNMVMDNIGIAISAGLTWSVRNNLRMRTLLPLVSVPCWAALRDSPAACL